ncbi:MAG TPA: hypothetical protein VH351_14535 [Bryobacteraceae bacterium]|nr:hypothetical protein [Bryobacteraceae bacterium]
MTITHDTANRSKTVSALQVTYADEGSESIGLLTQIPRTAELAICGPGFSERTVKVRFNGLQYFVFREDIQEFESTF